jgi:hypothetical protein
MAKRGQRRKVTLDVAQACLLADGYAATFISTMRSSSAARKFRIIARATTLDQGVSWQPP